MSSAATARAAGQKLSWRRARQYAKLADIPINEARSALSADPTLLPQATKAARNGDCPNDVIPDADITLADLAGVKGFVESCEGDFSRARTMITTLEQAQVNRS